MAEKASLKKLYQEWLAQDAKDNNGTCSIDGEQLLPTMQVQGIIRQPDVYTVTKLKTKNEQNRV